jgi:hypothetical protein
LSMDRCTLMVAPLRLSSRARPVVVLGSFALRRMAVGLCPMSSVIGPRRRGGAVLLQGVPRPPRTVVNGWQAKVDGVGAVEIDKRCKNASYRRNDSLQSCVKIVQPFPSSLGPAQ